MQKSSLLWENVGPGGRSSFCLPVVPRADRSVVQLPVLAVRGAQAGKTLVVTAGVHGDEFEGIAALHRLYESLDPASLRGTLVAVPVTNPPAYEAGLRVNPDDRQDMARIFPGDGGGTVTEQLAHCLTNEFIQHADFYLDLHSAGQYYRMPPLVGYQLRPEPLLSAQRAAALAVGMPLVWGTPGYPGRSISAAAELGVPALYTEITGEGRCREEDVNVYLACVQRLMVHLGMLEGQDSVPRPQWVVEDERPQAGFLQVQNRAPVGGYFEPVVAVLDRVEKGTRVGVIRDPLGQEMHVATAAHSGLVIFLRTFPRVHAGDPLCTVVEMG